MTQRQHSIRGRLYFLREGEGEMQGEGKVEGEEEGEEKGGAWFNRCRPSLGGLPSVMLKLR